MLEISRTNQFKKDVKISQKRNKDFSKFKEVIEFLVSEIPLPEKYKDHKLREDYLDNCLLSQNNWKNGLDKITEEFVILKKRSH